MTNTNVTNTNISNTNITNTYVGGGFGPWIAPPWMPGWMIPPVVIPTGGVIIDTFIPETTIVDVGPVPVDPTAVAPPTFIPPPTAVTPASPGGDGGEITIFSPESNQFVISYAINGTPFEMNPGDAQTFINDQPYTIEFLGSSTGTSTRYQLRTGRYKFKLQDGAVGLFATRDLPGMTPEAPPQPTPEPPPPAPTATPSQPPATLAPPLATTQPGVSRGTISLFIRPESRFQMVYALNDEPFKMSPGELQEFDNDRKWVIQFLGSSTGTVSTITLERGFYEFVLSNDGVTLRKAEGPPEPPATTETAKPPLPGPVPNPPSP